MNPSKRFYEYFLWPFSLIYGIAVGIRNALFDLHLLKSEEFDLPVISVGNLTAGGTGKTPFTEYLVSILKDRFLVATLSRGYKRSTNNFRYVHTSSTAEEAGDEPLQIKRKFPDITVAVDKKRVHGIQEMLKNNAGLNVILLDDAFQHRYVKPGLSILLIDYNSPVSSENFLPFGRLREPVCEKKRAHIVVVTKCPENIKPIDQRLIQKDLRLFAYQTLYFTSIKYDGLFHVYEHDGETVDRDEFRKNKFDILMVTGIAHSRLLKKYIRGYSPKITELKYPDHHTFSLKDIYHILDSFNKLESPKKIIVTTEKDAIRLQKFHNIVHPMERAWYYVPIRVSFIGNEEDLFTNQIVNYVAKNKRNSILS